MKRGEPNKHYYSRIVQELKVFNVYNAKELIFEVASCSKLPGIFIPLYNSENEYFKVVDTNNIFTEENYIYWLLGLFYNQKEAILRFNLTRRSVNKDITYK